MKNNYNLTAKLFRTKLSSEDSALSGKIWGTAPSPVYKFIIKSISIFLVLFAGFLIVDCKKKQVEQPKNMRPVISEEGLKIKFDPESPGLGQIKVSKFGEGEGFITIAAPSRVIASISKSVSGGRIVLFESPDINGMYASYQVSKTSLIRASSNSKRYYRSRGGGKQCTGRNL